MQALQTLVPVLFMIGLGYVSKIRKWVTPEQEDGASRIVFGLLFPIMVFNLLSSTDLKPETAGIVGMVFLCYCLFYLAGRTLLKRYFQPYSQIAPFLLTTAEGGNLAVPLYLSIIGASSPDAGTPMLLDLAGIFFCFLAIPVLVAASTSQKVDSKKMIERVFRSPMIIAALGGLLVNVCGIYRWMADQTWFPVYSQTLSIATMPIIPVVLYIIGYSLNFSIKIFEPVFKLVSLRVVLFLGIIGLLYFLFPSTMASPHFAAAAWLYFMGPVGFGVLPQISPLLKTENDKSYCSGAISLNMIVTLIIYLWMAVRLS